MKKILVIFILIYSIGVFAKGQHKLDTTPEPDSNVLSLELEENYYHIANKTSQSNTNYINAILSYSFDYEFDA